ncbi:hypothetical protein Tco_1087730 [Tanacetum coccineum]
MRPEALATDDEISQTLPGPLPIETRNIPLGHGLGTPELVNHLEQPSYPIVSTIYVTGLNWIWNACWAGPTSCEWIGSCTKSSDLDDCLHNESKPLALPWGRTPRLDSGVRVREHVVRDMCVRSGTLVGQGSVIIVIAAANYLPRTLVNPLQCIAEAE